MHCVMDSTPLSSVMHAEPSVIKGIKEYVSSSASPKGKPAQQAQRYVIFLQALGG